MQLQDQRHTAHSLTYDELTTTEKDEFANVLAYMTQYRTCSLCGVTFSLRHSLANGTSCPVACRNNTPRDHIDHESEKYESFNLFRLSYRLHLVLKSKGIWPNHRYIDFCTREILPEGSTRQPEAVVVSMG